jgi:hypothetical protein
MIRLDNWHMDGADNKCILQDVSCMEWIDLVSSVWNHTQFCPQNVLAKMKMKSDIFLMFCKYDRRVYNISAASTE